MLQTHDPSEGCLPELRQRLGVRSLGVFGSYVRGQQTRGSDLDVLVEFEAQGRPSLLGFVGLQQELSDVLGVKVDLVDRVGLKPHIGRRVLEEVIDVGRPREGLARLEALRRNGRLARPREFRDALRDIDDNAAAAQRFTEGLDFDAFTQDSRTVYAILHALLIIGEAARQLPADLRRRLPRGALAQDCRAPRCCRPRVLRGGAS